MSPARAERPLPSEESPLFAWLVTGAALLLALSYLRFHAPWRDEEQAWALVLASRSPSALWHNLLPEAHPILWYLLLAALQTLTHAPLAMALVHCALAVTAIWLLARHAPFPPWLRALIACGYFILVEYFAISRAYVLCEVLTFACCVELRGKRRPWRLAFLLMLLAQSELFGAMLGAGLCAAWAVLEWNRRRAPGLSRRLRDFAGALALYALSAGFCLFEVWRRTTLHPNHASAFAAVPQLPSPGGQRVEILRAFFHFLQWPFFAAAVASHLQLAAAVSVLVLLALTLSLWPSRAGLTYWLFSAGPLLVFASFAPVGPRHHGMLVIAFIAACWLAAPEAAAAAKPAPSALASKLSAGFVALFFFQQAVCGVLSAARDLVHPYSAGKAAAAYLQEKRLTNLPMICDVDYAAVTVLAMIDRPCFFPSTGRTGLFATWGPERTLVDADKLARAITLQLQDAPLVLLILSHPLQTPLPGVVMLASFTNAVVGEERFYLYRVTRPRETPAR